MAAACPIFTQIYNQFTKILPRQSFAWLQKFWRIWFQPHYRMKYNLVHNF